MFGCFFTIPRPKATIEQKLMFSLMSSSLMVTKDLIISEAQRGVDSEYVTSAGVESSCVVESSIVHTLILVLTHLEISSTTSVLSTYLYF